MAVMLPTGVASITMHTPQITSFVTKLLMTSIPAMGMSSSLIAAKRSSLPSVKSFFKSMVTREAPITIILKGAVRLLRCVVVDLTNAGTGI